MTPRPCTISEVSQRAQEGESFEYELADVLHEFAFRGEITMHTARPAILPDRLEKGDAYLAVIAVSFAAKQGQLAPKWTRHPDRILREPWFANPGRHIRAVLVVESPAAFRERNLF